jgi:small subunit ribosomal protein S17
MDNPRGKRKEQVGVVLSNKMQKTIIVKVGRMARHQRYGKIIRKFNKFKAHDENNQAKIGDKVLIEETRPISKDKRWRLVEILK